jgi:hypothetical protein
MILDCVDELIHKLWLNQLEEFYLEPGFCELEEYDRNTLLEAGISPPLVQEIR